jgi:hypothetical protein
MLRIRKTEEGYIVERRVKHITFWRFFVSKWIPYLEVSGMPGVAWNHSSYGSAMRNLLNKVEKDTNFNSPC